MTPRVWIVSYHANSVVRWRHERDSDDHWVSLDATERVLEWGSLFGSDDVTSSFQMTSLVGDAQSLTHWRHCTVCRWWDNKRTCDEQDESTRSEQVEFGLEHMAGVFIVGILGLGAALALFLFKKFYLFIRPARKEGCNGGVTSSKQQLTLMAGREKEKLCQSNTSFV